MIVELSKTQFSTLVKEAIDSMTDSEYIAFVRYIAADAKLRGLHVELDVRVATKERRVARRRADKEKT